MTYTGYTENQIEDILNMGMPWSDVYYNVLKLFCSLEPKEIM